MAGAAFVASLTMQTWVAATDGDPNWANVLLLVPVIDAPGTTAFTDLAYGTPAQLVGTPATISSSPSPKFPAYSVYDSASGEVDYVNSALTFGGDFTVEAWVYAPSAPASEYSVFLLMLGTVDGPQRVNCTISPAQGGSLTFNVYGSGTPAPVLGAVATGQWNHLAMSRAGGQLSAFVNGVVSCQVGLVSGTLGQGGLRIGVAQGGTAGFKYQQIRVSNISRYSTSGFTPPAAPFGMRAGTGAAFITAIQLNAATTVSTAITASLTTSPGMSTAPTFSATVGASLTTAIKLASTQTFGVAISVSLAANAAALAANLTATTATSAALTTGISLSSALTHSTAISATLAGSAAALASSLTATSATTAALTTAIKLVASPTVSVTAVAALTTGITLSAALTQATAISASLAANAAALAANLTATASTNAAPTTGISLSAALTQATAVSATLASSAAHLQAALTWSVSVSAAFINPALIGTVGYKTFVLTLDNKTDVRTSTLQVSPITRTEQLTVLTTA